jgi:hypothetical protein
VSIALTHTHAHAVESPAAETAIVVRLTSTPGETRVCVSDTVSYIDVLTPIEHGRVVIFDLETSGFGVEDRLGPQSPLALMPC